MLASRDMKEKIDRSSPVPFYYQLKQLLVADLESRALSPGDRLPGDHELCDTYGVSRTVVRQALSELETEGIIERLKGRGTFVAPPKTTEGLVQTLTGLYEDVAARGAQLRSDVRRLEVVPADQGVADNLQIGLGSPTILLERLRYVDGEPWVYTKTQIPYDLAPGLLEEDFSDKSLYALLEGKYGITLSHGRRSVEASAASVSLAHSLNIDAGDPVLVLRSVIYGTAGQPIEVFVAYHRGDRSRFEVDLTRGRSVRG